MKSEQIRESFLKFFESKGHLRWPSASLIPVNDPTILLMTAGMAPFKDYFAGNAKPPSEKITTCQKCLRADDIDFVGKTARHHTFFEMLGNFSFGDYYKKEAILLAWEYMTKVVKLPKEKLWITVHTDDKESFEIWKKDVGIRPERIYKLKDNFWGPVGDTGPCGPCSEICYDLGPEFGCGKKDCQPGCDCDRFLEIWNLVFTGLDKQPNGSFNKLPSQGIDTGLGLERLVMVLQGKSSPFETDIFEPLIKKIMSISAKKRCDEIGKQETDKAVRIIADHLRALVFMIADGVAPSNTGRGYVLRRLLRRAVYFGKKIGINNNFLSNLVDSVIDIMGGIYPEISQKVNLIKEVILSEEEAFRRTLDRGSILLEEELQKIVDKKEKVLSGKIVFELYDTFGFPLDLTKEAASSHRLKLDETEFNKLLEEQRNRAKADFEKKISVSSSDKNTKSLKEFSQNFTGYKMLESESEIMGIADYKDNHFIIYINPTPFYAESGGQIGDTGKITADGLEVEVINTIKEPDGKFAHISKIIKGKDKTKPQLKVKSKVDHSRRLDIERHHTATHLLQAALRRILGGHVTQSGSHVSDIGLRFDFSHTKALTKDEIKKVEELVNEKITEDIPLLSEEKELNQALKSGALAFFGDKYDKVVRVVKIGEFSCELCGGTHLESTGQIGCFKIIHETALGTGLRRIEAVCGKYALKVFNDYQEILKEISEEMKAPPAELPSSFVKLKAIIKEQQKTIEELSFRDLDSKADDLTKAKQKKIGDYTIIVSEIKNISPDNIKITIDKIAEKVKKGVVVLGTVYDNKAVLIAKAPKDLVDKGFHIGKIIQESSAVLGGKGGGRPDFAQAGGKEINKLKEALKKSEELILKQLFDI